MKPLLLLFFLFTAYHSFGQSQETSYVYTDTLDVKLNTWKNQALPLATIQYFDPKNLLIKSSEILGFVTDNQALKRETVYTYNPKNQKIREEIKGISATNGLYKTLNEWTYNEFDSLASDKQAFYDFSLKAYTTSNFHRYSYNAQRQLLIDSERILADNTSEIEVSKTVFEYDNNGNQIRASTSNTINNNRYIIENEYNTQNKISKKTFLSNDNTGQSMKFFYEYEYDSRGNLITRSYSDSWLSNRQNITIQTKEEYQFDANNQAVSYTIAWYNKTSKSLEQSYKRTNKYSQEGLLIQSNAIAKDAGYELGIFENTQTQTLTDYEYYANKKLKEVIEKTSTGATGILPYQVIRKRYAYQNQEVISDAENKYLVYPNPAKDIMKIENTLKDDCLTQIQLLDFAGNLVQTFKSENENSPVCECTIVLPKNLASGIYLLHLVASNGQVFVKKVSIMP